jgi:DNA-binding HxlR family transcriptional regulator
MQKPECTRGTWEFRAPHDAIGPRSSFSYTSKSLRISGFEQDMARRNYQQSCALATALDVVGERWTLLLIRELLIGPRRFNQLLAGLRGIGTNLLAERLKQLENAGVVARMDPAERDSGYQLTAMGSELREAVYALVRWGTRRLPISFDDEHLSRPEWDMVAINALFQPDQAADVKAVFQFEVDGFCYFARIDCGTLRVGPGITSSPDLTIRTDRATLAAIGRGAAVEAAVAAGRLQLSGYPAAIDSLRRAFISAASANHHLG